MRRTIPAIVAALAAVPVGVTTWAATHAPPATPTPAAKSAAHATPTPKTKAKHTTAHARATATAAPRAVSIMGPSVDMDWGPVQVTIVVQGKKLVDVKATAPMERARSNYINSQALPWLRQEALQAQSANIDLIGGATLTSEAYAQSLQAALDQAHM
jgi:uncharacterized protein with FMN-binding domain